MAAAQEPAVTQLSVLERPIVGNPVVLQDVTNAIRFVVFGILSHSEVFIPICQFQLPFGLAEAAKNNPRSCFRQCCQRSNH